MIVLDTNVVSEPLRRNPEPRVVEWIDAQAIETLYMSAITVAQIRYGSYANLWGSDGKDAGRRVGDRRS